jgi:hypothetical protein
VDMGESVELVAVGLVGRVHRKSKVGSQKLGVSPRTFDHCLVGVKCLNDFGHETRSETSTPHHAPGDWSSHGANCPSGRWLGRRSSRKIPSPPI